MGGGKNLRQAEGGARIKKEQSAAMEWRDERKSQESH